MPKLQDIVPKPKTRVAFIIDRSGSMRDLSKFVVDTFNEQLQELQRNAENQEITVSVVFFDSIIDIRSFDVPLSDIKTMEYDEYKTGASTALNDAIGTTIDKIRVLDDSQDDNVSHLMIIITDGYENASKEYSQSTISNYIKDLQETNWTFTYQGANVDVGKVAQQYNFDLGNTVSYSATADGLRLSSEKTSRGIGKFMQARTSGKIKTSSFYEENKDEELFESLVGDEKNDKEEEAAYDIHMGNKSLWEQAIEANEKLKIEQE